MTKDEVVKYWLESSEIDFQAMKSLFKNGHYVWALFLGHLVLEKLLKAFYVKNISSEVPYTHQLLNIARKAKLTLSKAQEDFLDEVTTFNIKTRYPDYKNRFYRKAKREFTKGYITRIQEFRLWLIKKIKSQSIKR